LDKLEIKLEPKTRIDVAQRGSEKRGSDYADVRI